MAQSTIVFWRDIPAQVIVAEGRKKAKRQLSDRFQHAIDAAAMRAGCHGTEDYLADWRKGSAEACGADLETEVDVIVGRIDAGYDEARLTELINNSGRELS